MLKLLDITKEYKVDEESILALHAVDIEFRKNEFVSVLGPSGCGKTTLLNIIGGLDRYTNGDIQINGVSTKKYDDVDWDTYRNRKVGFVFQSYNLIPHMNILKNVAMSLTLAGISNEERKARALDALRKVGLSSQARKKPNQLSGGQMQRVAIARALVNNPEIILADEPTGALDSESGIQVMDLLKEVAEDRLVIMVTHNPLLAEQYSTRIVYLKDGELEGDTMPYDHDKEVADAENARLEAKDADEDNASLEAKAADEDNASLEAKGAKIDEPKASPVKRNKASDKIVKSKEASKDDANETTENISDVVANESEVSRAACISGGDKKTVAKEHKKCCAERKKSKFELYYGKVRASDKSSMKIRTAVSLSFNNLLSKKGRTLLTSIAGSIGIIGIILVLSLSSGISGYVKTIEENALSQYPIQLNETNADLSSILGMLTVSGSGRPDYPSSDIVHTNKVIGNLMENLDQIVGKNDLTSLKIYLDENFDENLGQVKYNYGTSFNIYSQNVRTGAGGIDSYSKLYPFTDVMDGLLGIIGGSMPDMQGQIKSLASMLDAWDEISDDTRLLNQQYDLLGKSSWPNEANEIIIVLDEKNQINDYTLFMLGLKSVDDVLELLDGKMAESTFTIDELLKLKFSVLTNADYLEKKIGLNDNPYWESKEKSTDSVEFIDAHRNKDLELKVVGVVRPKKGAVVTSINSVVGYTHALTEELIKAAKNNEAIVAQNDAYSKGGSDSYESRITYSYNMDSKDQPISIIAGQSVTKKTSNNIDDVYVELMRSLGVVELSKPKSIKIYCSTFEAKDKIVALLKNYEKDTGHAVKYTDYLEMIMGYVRTMTTTITGALIGFSAISLLVSTIMIAIIIYTSVLERRKEIGVLRSLGARKKDISRVFLAESAMLGGYSGVIGLIVSAIIAAIGNFILLKLFNISNLMQITWWHCIMMIAISVFLSMFAGFIPSRIAAKKDPAIALRSE